MIQLIAAIDENNGLGYQGDMLFWIKEDLKHFKETTSGGTVIMGRKTYDSLPKGALPKRRNMVITRNKDFSAERVEVFHSLEDAIKNTLPDEKVFIIGGASIYEKAMPLADRLIITHIHAAADKADVFFPKVSEDDWKVLNISEQTSEKDNIDFDVTIYEKKTEQGVYLKRINKEKDPELHSFMEDLMVRSFPEIEYRSFDDLEKYSEAKEEFHNTIVMDGDKPVGFLTFWDLGDFYYFEHLAITPDIRNMGYGHKVLAIMRECFHKPIVFEVEIPEDELTTRRVNLYKRNGFDMLGNDYVQPPYRKGFEDFPMRVMVRAQGCKMPDFEEIVNKIHKTVYRVGEE